jgi:hypothetical protein
VINDEIQPGTHKKDQLGVQNKKQLEAANLKGIEAQTEVETAGNEVELMPLVEPSSTSTCLSDSPRRVSQTHSRSFLQGLVISYYARKLGV